MTYQNGHNLNGTGLVSADILNQIDEKRFELYEDPFFDQEIRQKEFSIKWVESVAANARLENLLAHATSRGVDRAKCLSEARTVLDNLSYAWTWGTENFKGILDKQFLIHLGYLIDPKINMHRLRNIKSFIKGTEYLPPSYGLKIEMKTDEFINKFNSLQNPVEKAVYSHFSCFLIQPFDDGNKRAGRTLQNIVLHHYKLPPVIIPDAELRHYLDLLIQAFEAHHKLDDQTKTSAQERSLYQWLSCKEMVSLDEILKRMRDEKKFAIQVDMKKKDKSGCLLIKHALKSLMDKRSLNGTVRYTPNSEQDFIVKGALVEEEIMTVLDSISFVKSAKVKPYVLKN